MKRVRWCFPYLLVVMGLVVATSCDLTLAKWCYRPDQPLAVFFERLALLPLECMIPLCFYGLYQSRKHMVNLVGYTISMVVIGLDALKYWVSWQELWWLWLMVLLLACLLLGQGLRRVPRSFWQEHEAAMRFFLTTALVSFAVVFGMKSLWGRVRFREMGHDFSLFTPWYVVRGFNGHHSFPSAHTATMSLIFCRHFVLRMKGRPVRIRQVILDCVAVMVMMATRMMMGAHFLSDVLMGFAITYTIILLVYRWMRREGFDGTASDRL